MAAHDKCVSGLAHYAHSTEARRVLRAAPETPERLSDMVSGREQRRMARPQPLGPAAVDQSNGSLGRRFGQGVSPLTLLKFYPTLCDPDRSRSQPCGDRGKDPKHRRSRHQRQSPAREGNDECRR